MSSRVTHEINNYENKNASTEAKADWLRETASPSLLASTGPFRLPSFQPLPSRNAAAGQFQGAVGQTFGTESEMRSGPHCATHHPNVTFYENWHLALAPRMGVSNH